MITEKQATALGHYITLHKEVEQLHQERSKRIQEFRRRLQEVDSRPAGEFTNYDHYGFDCALIEIHQLSSRLSAIVAALNQHAADAERPRLRIRDLSIVGSVSAQS